MLISGMAGGIAGAAARSVVEGTSFGDNLMRALPDVIGSTLGNAIANGAAGAKDKQIGHLGDYLPKPPEPQGVGPIAAGAEDLATGGTALPMAAPDAPDDMMAGRIDPFRDAFEKVVNDIESGRKDLLVSAGNLAEKLRKAPNRAANEFANSLRGDAARDITKSEAAVLRRALGKDIDLSDVRIVKGPGDNKLAKHILERLKRPATTFGNTVYVRADLYQRDMSKTRDGVGLLAHEFTHVLQFQQIGFTAVVSRIGHEAARHGPNGAYDYRSRSLTYRTETLEGRAQMVEDYTRLREMGVRPKERALHQILLQKLKGSGIYGQ
jgi:hypothetical protein